MTGMADRNKSSADMIEMTIPYHEIMPVREDKGWCFSWDIMMSTIVRIAGRF